MSLSFLQNIGLSDHEAIIYEFLVKNGEVPISLVVKNSKLKRPTVYKILYSLEEKGLVQLHDIKKKLHAKPQSPAKLLDFADAQFDSVNRTRENLLSVIPGLNSLYIKSTEQPVVRTYEGIDGLKEIYEDMIIEKKPIFALVQAATVDLELYEWLAHIFIRKRIRAKIHVKALVASSVKSQEYVEKSPEEYRTAKLVDSKLFPFEHEVDVYGDKVAFIHYKRGEPLIGVVITHPSIAATCKAWFDLAWNGATN